MQRGRDPPRKASGEFVGVFDSEKSGRSLNPASTSSCFMDIGRKKTDVYNRRIAEPKTH